MNSFFTHYMSGRIWRTVLGMLIVGLFLTACEYDNNGSNDISKQEVSLKLNISVSTHPTRANSLVNSNDDMMANMAWDDSKATDGEMMRNCFVVAVQSGTIVGILVSEDFSKEKSQSETLAMKLEAKPTIFYSFANIKPSQIGIDPSTCVGTTAPDFDNMTFGVDGNADSPTDFDNGIPMSGKMSMTLTDKTQAVDLEVVRMVAKVKVSLSNDTPADFKVKSMSISDITDNSSGNILLLPRYADSQSCLPNIAANATKSVLTKSLTTGNDGTTLKANRANTVETTFYVNESEASVPKYFVINVETDQTSIAHRVALLTWNTISRGDYLHIPIRLNDYRITYDVEQFTAIGVLPSVDNDKDMLTVKFNGYGEFHMRPTVTRLSDGKVLTPGTDADDGWTLVDWSVLELSPDGDEGTCIYDRMPIADHSRRMFEGVIGNRKGYALHQVLFHVKGLAYDIPYKVQIIHE